MYILCLFFFPPDLFVSARVRHGGGGGSGGEGWGVGGSPTARLRGGSGDGEVEQAGGERASALRPLR